MPSLLGKDTTTTTAAITTSMTTTTTTTTTTTVPEPKCQEGKYPNKLNIFKNKPKSTWEECRNFCKEKLKCAYFNWKISTKECSLSEMLWTTDLNFESGKKFCPTETTPPSCKNAVYVPKKLLVSINSPTTTWHACRDFCDADNDCEYFKWKVYIKLIFTLKPSLNI